MVRLVTADVDVGYFWHESPVPGSLEIVKVYGFLFCPDTAGVLVQECDGRFSLPGGSPEPADAVFVGFAAGGQRDDGVAGDGPADEDAESAVADQRWRAGLVVMGESEGGSKACCMVAAGGFRPCLLDGDDVGLGDRG
jgi:hypothetical protein